MSDNLIVRDVHFYGQLKSKYGAKKSFPASRIDLLLTGIAIDEPSLLDDIAAGEYLVYVGDLKDENIVDLDDLMIPFSDNETQIHLYESLTADKSKVGKLVFGTALIALSFYVPGGGMLGLSQATVQTALLSTGANLALAGATALLADQPQNTDENDQSIFSSGLNNANAGSRIPLIYGGPTRAQSTIVDLEVSSDEVLQNDNGDDILDSKIEHISRSVHIIGEGTIAGPTLNGVLTDELLENSVYVNDISVSNFQDSQTEVHFRDGSTASNNNSIAGFTESSQLINANIELDAGTWKVLNIPAANNAVKLNLAWEGLYSVGEKYYTSQTAFEVQVSVNNGAWQTSPKWLRRQESMVLKPMAQTYRIDRPTAADQSWRIRIKRLVQVTETRNVKKQDMGASGGGAGAVYVSVAQNFVENPADDSTHRNKKHTNKFSLASYNLIVGKTANKYTDCAYYGLTIPASDVGGNLRDIWFKVWGLEIPLPNNYFINSSADSRFSTAAFTGMTKKGVSKNPALILLDLIRNQRYAHGKLVEDYQIDYGAFMNAARWCDNLVDNIDGTGQERRFEFSGQLSTALNSYKMMAAVASSFYGKILIQNGVISVVWDDDNTDSIAIIDNNDVLNSNFSYSSVPDTSRHTQVVGKWRDPAENFELSSVVANHADIATRGLLTNSVELIGCQRLSQAQRHVQWIMESNNRNTELVEWQMPITGALYKVGQIVTIRDENNRFDATVYDVKFKITGVDISSDGVNYKFQGLSVDEQKVAAYKVLNIDPVSGLVAGDIKVGGANVSAVQNLQITESTIDRVNSRVLICEWDAPSSNPQFLQHYVVLHNSPTGHQERFTVTQERIQLNAQDEGLHSVTVFPVSVTSANGPKETTSLFIEDVATSGSALNNPLNLRLVTGSSSNTIFTSKDLHVRFDDPDNIDNEAANLSHYLVEFKKQNGDLLHSTNAVGNRASFLYEQNRASNDGIAERVIVVDVTAIDVLGRSSTSTSRTFSNPAPAGLSGFSVTSVHLNSVEWIVNASTETDVEGNRVRQADNSSMSNSKIVYDGKNTSGSITVSQGEDLYFQCGAYDSYSDSVNWSSVKNVTTINNILNSSYIFQGFRVFVENGKFVVTGKTITYKAPDGTISDVLFDNTQATPNNRWIDANYNEFTRRYYYFDQNVGSNGGMQVSFNATDVFASDGSRINVAVTEGGEISTGERIGMPIQHRDSLGARVVYAEHIVADESVIENSLQVGGQAVINTINIKSGDVSKQEVLKWHGDTLNNSGNVDKLDMILYTSGHPSYSNLTWRYSAGSSNVIHSNAAQHYNKFPYALFYIPPTGDSEPVTVMMEWQMHVEAERASSAANIRYKPSMSFQYNRRFAIDNNDGTYTVPSQDTTWDSLTESLFNFNLSRENYYSSNYISGKFLIQSQGEELIRIRMEAAPYDMQNLVMQSNFKQLNFSGMRFTATAILR